MSYDSKNCRIVEKYLIDRTLLSEQGWVKSRVEVTCRSHLLEENRKKRCR